MTGSSKLLFQVAPPEKMPCNIQKSSCGLVLYLTLWKEYTKEGPSHSLNEIVQLASVNCAICFTSNMILFWVLEIKFGKVFNCLKGQCHEIFWCWFFHQIASPGPIEGTLG